MPDDDRAKKLIQRFDRLKSDRSVFESHWQEIRDYLLPLVQAFTGKESKGSKNRDKILDGSGEDASELFSSGMQGLMVNPGTKWFGLRTRRRDLMNDFSVRVWLETVRERMMMVFESADSGFSTSIGQTLQETGDFGQGGILITERPGKFPLFSARPLNELHLDENHEGKIDTVFRAFEMTARQAVEHFKGKGDPGAKVAADAETVQGADKPYNFLHVIMPRSDRMIGKINARNLPFASFWVNRDEKHLIGESGYHEFPLPIGRWRVRASEVYARSPGMRALSEVKMLQRSMRATIRAAEKTIDPPLLVPDDGVLAPIRVTDNAINYYRADMVNSRQPAIQAIRTDARPDIGEEFAEGIRIRIQRAYYNHLLQLSRDPRMTATQVIKLDEETLRVLGPFIGRLQAELLGLVIERVFGIMLRSGMLPDAPPILAGEDLEIEYESPIAKAQRLSEVSALGQLFGVFEPLLQHNDELLDNLDADTAFSASGDRLGVPKDWFRAPDKVSAMREARQQVAEERERISQVAQLASSAQSAGQAAGALQDAGVLQREAA